MTVLRSSVATALLLRRLRVTSGTALLRDPTTAAVLRLLLRTALRSTDPLTTLTTRRTRPLPLCQATLLPSPRLTTGRLTLRRCPSRSLPVRATRMPRNATLPLPARLVLLSWRRLMTRALVCPRLCLVLAMPRWTRTAALRRWTRWRALRTTRAMIAAPAPATSLTLRATNATAVARRLGALRLPRRTSGGSERTDQMALHTVARLAWNAAARCRPAAAARRPTRTRATRMPRTATRLRTTREDPLRLLRTVRAATAAGLRLATPRSTSTSRGDKGIAGSGVLVL